MDGHSCAGRHWLVEEGGGPLLCHRSDMAADRLQEHACLYSGWGVGWGVVGRIQIAIAHRVHYAIFIHALQRSAKRGVPGSW
jgi:hypothetical protein